MLYICIGREAREVEMRGRGGGGGWCHLSVSSQGECADIPHLSLFLSLVCIIKCEFSIL